MELRQEAVSACALPALPYLSHIPYVSYCLEQCRSDFIKCYAPTHHGGQYRQKERGGGGVAGALGDRCHQQTQQDADGVRRDALKRHQTFSQPHGKSRFLYKVKAQGRK